MSADADCGQRGRRPRRPAVLRQPLRGHRVGHDAILLAAAAGAQPGEHAVDLGAGVGAAGLALAQRVEGVAVTLVEIDPALAALARDNAERNRPGRSSARRVSRCGGVCRGICEAGLSPGSADRVLMNPPFNDAAKSFAAIQARRHAHVAQQGTLLALGCVRRRGCSAVTA